MAEAQITGRADRRRLIDVDVEAAERGLRGHVETENALAAALRQRGIAPLAPAAGEPLFDLAWHFDEHLYVAEVKSTTATNQERQLRLGLGQVLRYCSLLAPAGASVRAVLVPERAPIDETWAATCAAHDVVLLYPPALDDQLETLLR